MRVADAMFRLAQLKEVLEAARTLEKHDLLANAETHADIVKRYMDQHPELNALITKGVLGELT
ncbi:MAG: hypothetical protein ACSHWN_04630 [Methylophilaceae bacterium]